MGLHGALFVGLQRLSDGFMADLPSGYVRKLLSMAIEILDLPIQHGVFSAGKMWDN